MARVSDLQGLLRGMAKISTASYRVAPGEAHRLWDSSLLKPAAQQAVRLVLESKGGQEGSGGGKRAGIPVSRALDNLPLVVEGIQMYLSHLAGLPSLYQGPGKAASGQAREMEMEVDRGVSAMDLLEGDITDEAMLRSRIYRRKEVMVETPVVTSSEGGTEGWRWLVSSDGELKRETASSLRELQERLASSEGGLEGGLASSEGELKRDQASSEGGLEGVQVVPDVARVASRDKPRISSLARERRGPSSRVSRVASFASLGAGLAMGTAAEASRRAMGLGRKTTEAATSGSLVLTEANAERIVATLCRVRGAALKLGQILSIQDGAVIGPELQQIFDRVREAADFMPAWQLQQVLQADLGPGWREHFSQFSEQPFAAASIGQVHHATLLDGTQVAVKVQYPGVAKSIDSDIRNLLSLISLLAFLPEGLFIDRIAAHLKTELAQECDYLREAECGATMRRLLEPYPEYYVPRVFGEQSAGQVLTTEFITGLTIDQCTGLPQHTRNFIASSILKLIFRELFLNRYMQTDPNWANFLYNESTRKIGLLDFGATREFRPGFVNTYFKIIDCAAREDEAGVLEHSRTIGFLTGAESRTMNSAHVTSVMLLARPFQRDEQFDFGKQTITQEIQDLSTVMLKERLCPPPPEVYSLHRKLSGLFLLAGKLDARFDCYGIWQEIRSQFKPFPELAEESRN